MLQVIVDSRVRLAGALPAATASALKSDHEHKNPEVAQKRAIGVSTYGIPDVVRTWRLEDGVLTLPRGGMGRARERLAEHGVPFEVVDRRHEGMPCTRFPKYAGHPMRWYQEQAIERALAREQCILRMPTGAGKTEAALALLARIGLNALVILPTGGLFKQWSQRAAHAFKLREGALGVIQGKTRRLRPVTIAMQQTLARGVPEEVRDFFGAIVIDEAQLASARTYVEVVDQFPARYRVAVSADERRKDRKEFLAYDLFSDVAYEVKRDALERDGHVLDVQIRVVPTDFRADWYGLPSDGAKKEIDFNRLLDEMTADKERNALAARFVLEELAQGEQAIMLTARRDHVRQLDHFFVTRQVPSGYFLGEQEKGDDVEFERTRAGITSGELRVGIGTYKALGFGIDLPAVAVGCAATPIAGNSQALNQVRGRLCRPNPSAGKTQGRLYLMWDRWVYPGHLKKIMAANANVVVLDRGTWVEAREYVGRRRAG